MSESREHQPTSRRTYRVAGLRNRAGALPLASLGHVDDLVAAYALGALEADETAAVDAHVRTCSACERALFDAQRTAGMLSFVVPFQTPPADSKAALFARVAHARKAAAASSLPSQNLDAFRTPTIPNSSADELVLPARSAAVVSPQGERQARSGWLVSVVSVPLLIALIATGFWGFQLRNQLASQNSQLAELQAELTNFGSGTTSYSLSPGAAAPQAEGKIVMGSDQRAGMLQIDVNTNDGPRQFDLLVMNKDGNLVPVSEVTVSPDGKGQARFELDQQYSEYESFHIQAKPIDPSAAVSPADTLFQDNGGALGSTGSGLDTGP